MENLSLLKEEKGLKGAIDKLLLLLSVYPEFKDRFNAIKYGIMF